MQAELDTLETKLAQLLERYQATRGENLRLRQQVVSLENSNKHLNERLDETSSRLEALFNTIPD